MVLNLLWSLLLPGCLILSGPPGSVRRDICEDLDCAPYACQDLECLRYCIDDVDCADGYVCHGADCVAPCVASDCPDGFACSELQPGECNTYCADDDDCRSGYVCCTRANGCDETEHSLECVPED
jgi:hypothetical protein